MVWQTKGKAISELTGDGEQIPMAYAYVCVVAAGGSLRKTSKAR